MKRFALFILLTLSLAPGMGHGQEDKDARGGGRRGKIVFTEEVVRGKIVKPQVQFLISREKGSSEEGLTLKESFIPKIMDSVQQPPF